MTYIDDLAHAAFLCRAWSRIAEESRGKIRRAELEVHIKRLRAGEPSRSLSQINRMKLAELCERPSMEGKAPLEVAEALLEMLRTRRVGRGRGPGDELTYAIDAVARAFKEQTGKHPTMVKDGPFGRVVAHVIGVATKKPRVDLHSSVEHYLSHGLVTDEERSADEPGASIVRSFVPPRFARDSIS